MKNIKTQKLTQCMSLAAASLVLSGTVFAANKPSELSDAQLSNVTAAGSASSTLTRAAEQYRRMLQQMNRCTTANRCARN